MDLILGAPWKSLGETKTEAWAVNYLKQRGEKRNSSVK